MLSVIFLRPSYTYRAFSLHLSISYLPRNLYYHLWLYHPVVKVNLLFKSNYLRICTSPVSQFH